MARRSRPCQTRLKAYAAQETKRCRSGRNIAHDNPVTPRRPPIAKMIPTVGGRNVWQASCSVLICRCAQTRGAALLVSCLIIAQGQSPICKRSRMNSPKTRCSVVRPLSQDPTGRAGGWMNIGHEMTRDCLLLANAMGAMGTASAAVYRFVQSLCRQCGSGWTPIWFDDVRRDGREALLQSLRAYEAENRRELPPRPP